MEPHLLALSRWKVSLAFARLASTVVETDIWLIVRNLEASEVWKSSRGRALAQAKPDRCWPGKIKLRLSIQRHIPCDTALLCLMVTSMETLALLRFGERVTGGVKDSLVLAMSETSCRRGLYLNA